MKKIFLIISISFITISCNTRKLQLSNATSVQMPGNARVISQEEVAAVIKGYVKNPLVERMSKLYALDNILVGVEEQNDVLKEKLTFEKFGKQKKGGLQLAKYIVNDMQVRIFNNKRFLVFDYEDHLKVANSNYYEFYSDFERFDNEVNGFIRYDKATQQAEADKLLKSILSSLVIK